MAKYKRTIEDTLQQLKALSDANRLRIFMILQEQDVCVCHLTQWLELAPSTVSKHLSILKSAKLVQSTKKGQWIYYKANPSYPELIDSLKKDETLLQDHIKLKTIQNRSCV